MPKVYVVTSGDYSNYSINSVFSNREAAEKRCAVWDGRDEPTIEEYELEDGSNIEIEQVYKAIDFGMNYSRYPDNIYVYFDMQYASKPFQERITRNGTITMRDGKVMEMYYGVIPVNKTVETREEAEKIVYDRIAKWKTEQMGM